MVGGNADDQMERYAEVLDRLREDDCRRLRSWVDDGRAQFTTWLVLVVKRISLDHLRRLNGRPQGTGAEAKARHAMRRRLAALIAVPDALDDLADEAEDGAELAVRATELHVALEEALSGLSASDRLILKLRFEDDLSVPVIARLVRSPSAGHLYRHIDQLLARLRLRLVASGISDSQP